jgi:feruloyl esterase
MEMFMVPGMLHCAGGDGTDQFDAVDAVMKWVEHGERPKQLAASHATAGKIDRTRPLCPYPQVATYQGRGSTDEARNFICR